MDFNEFVLEEAEHLARSQEVFLDKDSWSEIVQAKQVFIEHGTDPRLSPVVRPEVAFSWIACKKMGLDPNSIQIGEPISKELREQRRKRYATLIESVKPLMRVIENFDFASDYIFELIDADGISLTHTGDLDLHEFVSEEAAFNEQTIGTNAHSLCMRYRMPFQVLGPEHYCTILHSLAASAAPIIDSDGNPIAALLLTQPIMPPPWTEGYHRVLSHTLGIITSLASAVGYHMAYHRAEVALDNAESKISNATIESKRASHLFETAISLSKEGLIVANRDGTIQQMSPEAAHMLHTTPTDARGKPLGSFIHTEDDQDALSSKLAKRQTIPVYIGSRAFKLHATPVSDNEQNRCDGIILEINEAITHNHDLNSRKGEIGDIAPITFDDILGEDSSILHAKKLAKRFSETEENIILLGESGTGKDYFAQAIHNASKPEGPFMSINCASIPPRLIESELFGYEGGSFTGADKSGKPGKIELASGGTLFLDEIGDMPLELQATLLRVLENKRIMRIGGKGYRQVEFRVIAATNKDLAAMARAGTFREDLLYRLSILSIDLPPLRDRGNDKCFFLRYFMNECRRKNVEGPHGFTPGAVTILDEYSWPGNLRQMKNVVFSACFTARGELVAIDDLPPYVKSDRPKRKRDDAGEVLRDRMDTEQNSAKPAENAQVPPETVSVTPLRDVEEQAIRNAMNRVAGNVARAAGLLKIGKATLYRKLKEYGLEY